MMAVAIGLLVLTLNAQKQFGLSIGIPSLWNRGLGTAHEYAVAFMGLMRELSPRHGFYFAIFFSNIFQVVISGLHLLYNNLLTALFVTEEWNSYLTHRRPLRLSCPRGIQRSSYFLSLPWRYSLPLMVVSFILHWLVSQSVLLIQTVGYKSPDFDRDPSWDASVVGYSSIGIVLSLLLGTVMVTTLVAIRIFKKYNLRKMEENTDSPGYTMPLASTCSAAISVACHAHPEDEDAHLLPVRWGYVKDAPGEFSGHFRFTTARNVSYLPLEEIARRDRNQSTV